MTNITSNTSYLTLALIIQKLISFSYFIILTRYLGMEILGQYYTAVAFTTILALIIDLGLANILIREVAKDQARAAQWLRSIIGLKLILSLIAIISAFILAKLAGYDPFVLTLIGISFFAMILDSFTNTFFSVIRGFHNLKYESLAAVVFQLIILSGGWLMMQAGLDAHWLMSVMAMASLINFIFSSSVIRWRFHLKISPIFNWSLIKKIFTLSWPFAVFNILQRLYTYFDSLLLGFLASYFQVGLYQIAFKIVFALQFIPLAFVASLYPAFSVYWQNNRSQLSASFKKAINYLIIISLPIIFGVITISTDVVILLKAGEEAIWPLRVMILSLIFIFLNFPIGSLLNACDRQRRHTFNMGIATASSLILNLIFIPLWQALGASLTVFLTNMLMFILGWRAVRPLIDYRLKESRSVFLKSLLAALAMAMLVIWSRELIGVYLAVLLGAIFYFSFLFIIGGFKQEDIKNIYQSFNFKFFKK